MEITIGTAISKPVQTQAQCTAYAAMAEAVNAHNAACTVGDALWTIEDGEDCYTVAEDGTVPEPETPAPAVEDDLAALMVDHEYRITLLELGVAEE
mgnify:FL=1